MALPILVVMLIQLPTSLETRVIEPRDATVSLVGRPCGDSEAKVLATVPTTPIDTTAPLRSEPFQCGPVPCRYSSQQRCGCSRLYCRGILGRL